MAHSEWEKSKYACLEHLDNQSMRKLGDFFKPEASFPWWMEPILKCLQANGDTILWSTQIAFDYWKVLVPQLPVTWRFLMISQSNMQSQKNNIDQPGRTERFVPQRLPKRVCYHAICLWYQVVWPFSFFLSDDNTCGEEEEDGRHRRNSYLHNCWLLWRLIPVVRFLWDC